MFKRLIVMSAFALIPATLAIGPAFAQDSYDLSVVTKAPFANVYRTSITVTGTYTCYIGDPWTPSPEWSGLGVNVTQIQKGRTVVSGNGGLFNQGGYPVCNGVPQVWTVDVQAFGGGNFFGIPATWKSGKATVQVNGNASDGDCQLGANCIGDQLLQVIQITNS